MADCGSASIMLVTHMDVIITLYLIVKNRKECLDTMAPTHVANIRLCKTISNVIKSY